MAVPALVGPRTLAESLKLGSSDLRFTLSRNDVPDDMQAHFFENGVTSVSKFSSFSRGETDLVNVLGDEFNMDAATLEDPAKVAAVICSWKDTDKGKTPIRSGGRDELPRVDQTHSSWRLCAA